MISKVVVILAIGMLVGCIADEDRCSPDQQFVEGVCRSIEADADVDTKPIETDGSVDTEQGPDAADLSDDAANDVNCLGNVCKDQTECEGCAADYCAIPLGQTIGYCTLTGCDPANDDCPDGYKCLDLTGVEPSIPKFCAAPL